MYSTPLRPSTCTSTCICSWMANAFHSVSEAVKHGALKTQSVAQSVFSATVDFSKEAFRATSAFSKRACSAAAKFSANALNATTEAAKYGATELSRFVKGTINYSQKGLCQLATAAQKHPVIAFTVVILAIGAIAYKYSEPQLS